MPRFRGGIWMMPLLAGLVALAGLEAPAGATAEPDTGAHGGMTAPDASEGARYRAGRMAPEIVRGLRARVKVRLLPNGSFLATEIEPDEDQADEDEELRAVIESVDPAARTLRILGFTVALSPDAEITREPSGNATFEDLVAGLRVRADGAVSPDGTFLAKRIRIRESQYAEHRMVGRITEVRDLTSGTATLKVLGVTVLVNESTDLQVEGKTRQAFRARRIGLVDEDDLVFLGERRIGRHIAWSGEFRIRYEQRSNPDLDASTSDGTNAPELFTIMGATAGFGPVSLYGEIEGNREYFIRGGEPTAVDDSRGKLRVSQAYIELVGIPRLAIVAGRQKFQDERKWYYDNKNLDAVRIFADLNPVTLEASISRDLFDKELNRSDQDRTNLIFRASWRPVRDVAIEGYYIDRDDRTKNQDSPRLIGLRAIGDPGRHVDFWLDLVREDGTRGRTDPLTRSLVVRPIDAHAIDAGLTFRPRASLDPSFTASWALASGDHTPVPASGGLPRGTDGTFRQSGLHRDRGTWNGLVSFRYYGEVLAPELTNLRVLTLGAGLRPGGIWSTDLVYHRYRQDVASPRLERTKIDERPSGLDPQLGSEWDLILGYEPGERLELRLTAGRFDPAGAFPRHATASTIVTFQSKFRF